MDEKSRAKFEMLVTENRPMFCRTCREKMRLIGGGKYKCDSCGEEVLDDFGKIKEFLDANGPATRYEIERETGVRGETVDLFLRKGRIEIPEGSKYFIQCEQCGCNIRFGRYCPACAKQIAGGIKAIFNEDVGERPKHAKENSGKMHFLNKH